MLSRSDRIDLLARMIKEEHNCPVQAYIRGA
ncbi:hypothetical protein MPTA5024_07815 [Microbispora sp. ATCC PTA-5024]|nr:hypothetical protein MPTA5024_07815 [Microbispora sp. ATCC PTA-5024]